MICLYYSYQHHMKTKVCLNTESKHKRKITANEMKILFVMVSGTKIQMNFYEL